MMKPKIPHADIETALYNNSNEWKALIQRVSGPLTPIPTGTAVRLPALQGIKAVVFDIYGTLLISGSGEVGSAADTADTTDAHAQPAKPLSFAHAFKAVGITPSSSAERFNEVCTKLYTDSIKLRHSELRAGGIDYPEVHILDIWQMIWYELEETRSAELDAHRLITLALEYELSANPTWLMPNVPHTLQSISRAGYPLGIVSNAQFYTPLILEALCGVSLGAAGFREDLLVWSYRLGRAKPSVLMFDPLLDTLRKRYAIRPNEVLYVGNDMLNDIYTASASGCKTALFAGDRRSLRLRRENSLVQSLQSDAIMSDISHLQQLLELSHTKE
ncbi:MAG: HAD family hydrolase [Spirochaetota bacterium]